MTNPWPIRTVRLLAGVTLGILVIAVFVNVVLRFAFNSGFVVTEEVSRILLIWLVFGGAIAVLHSGQHIKMTMAVDRFGRRGQIVLAALGAVSMIFCDILLLFGAWRQLRFSLNDSFPVSGLPVAVVYAPGVFAACAFALITSWKLLRLLSGRIGPEDYFGLNAPDSELH